MPGWGPIVSAVIPHLAQIVSAAAPVFTKQGVVTQQIAELQQVAGSNARAIRELAGQVENVARALDELSAANGAALEQLRRVRLIAFAAAAAAAAALAVALVAMVRS
jgi:hypothetical protein